MSYSEVSAMGVRGGTEAGGSAGPQHEGSLNISHLS